MSTSISAAKSSFNVEGFLKNFLTLFKVVIFLQDLLNVLLKYPVVSGVHVLTYFISQAPPAQANSPERLVSSAYSITLERSIECNLENINSNCSFVQSSNGACI